MKLLIQAGAHVQESDNNGRMTLSKAADDNHEEERKILLDIRGNPYFHDKDGRTLLIYAAVQGYHVVAKLHITADPNLAVTDRGGRTALLSAATRGSFSMDQILISLRGVDPSSRDYFGRDAVYKFKRRGYSKITSLLLGDTSEDLPEDDLYLHCHACQQDNFDMCRFYEEVGASCFGKDHQLTRRAAQ